MIIKKNCDYGFLIFSNVNYKNIVEALY